MFGNAQRDDHMAIRSNDQIPQKWTYLWTATV